MAETKTVTEAIVPKRGMLGEIHRGCKGFATFFGETGQAAGDTATGLRVIGNLLVVEQTTKILERAGIDEDEFKSMCAT